MENLVARYESALHMACEIIGKLVTKAPRTLTRAHLLVFSTADQMVRGGVGLIPHDPRP